jgi:HEAT repeat protein
VAEFPYPGLKPFDRDDADVFFGRETHVNAMIDRLAEHRLLTVTGTSASGKSSLVRAGLLEALEMGLLAKAGRAWRFAIMRPGVHPLSELARTLLRALDWDREEASKGPQGRGPMSIIEELRDCPLTDGSNVLILVDQFEELFRYQDIAGNGEAETFVAVLLAARRQRDAPIYVVLTLRSDFLGNCARFDGLAEAVNEALFLCPRLRRDQIVAAIKGPANVFGGDVESTLIDQLIQDMGTDPDQLPLMQHALSRLWDVATKRDPAKPVMLRQDYLDANGLKGSLTKHADQILASVCGHDLERMEIVRRLFCLLTEGRTAERAVRRPVTLQDVIEVTGARLVEISDFVDPFREPSFVLPALSTPLGEDTVLDICQESLIRQWSKIGEWVRGEANSAEQYLEIERRALRWENTNAEATKKTLLWKGPDLEAALAWRKRERPTSAWARRYGAHFVLTMRFLDASAAEAELDRVLLKLASSDSMDRMNAVEALGRRGPFAPGVVPALTTALADANERVRYASAKALGRIGPTAIPALTAALGDASQRIRSASAIILGRFGPEAAKAIPALLATLGDVDEGVRRASATALGQIGAAAIPALITALHRGHREVRSSSATALGQIGPAAVESLIAMLGDADETVRRASATALGQIGPGATKAIRALTAAIRDTDGQVRCASATALGQIGPAAVEAAPVLIAALGDADEAVRRASATALGQIGPGAAKATAALTAAVRDADEQVRSASATALGQIGPAAAEAIPALIDALAEVKSAVGALTKMGPIAVPALTRALGDTNERIRSASATALGQIGPAAIPALTAALGNASERIRSASATALGQIVPAAATAIQALVATLADCDERVRCASATALGQIGPAAVPALIAALRGDHGGARRASITALGQIGPAAVEAAPVLIAALRDADEAVRRASATALGQIGPAAVEATTMLIAALRDADEAVRHASATALGQIGPGAADYEALQLRDQLDYLIEIHPRHP